MRKHWNGNNVSLPRRAGRTGQFSPSTRAWKRTAGIFALAVAAFLMLAVPGSAQTSASDGTATASANQPATSQAAPAPPNQYGQQVSTPADQEAGNTARADVRVVRLSDVEGSVQIMLGKQTEFSQAAMNMPLLQGSRIMTGSDGRAEIEFEDGSVARITPNSSLSLQTLATDANGGLNTAVDQLSGLIYYELRNDSRIHYTVLVGDRAVTPTVDSTFRVDLSANPAEVAVLDGAVRVEGAENSYQADVKQNQTIQFGAANEAKYTVADGIVPNGFDDWNNQRDQEAAQQAQNQTPARVQQGGGSIMDSGYGWSDLDSAGGWYPLPGYGMVWQPYGIGPGFNPYGYGMWGNYGPFGYAWISGYPWGWLPFHCGLWSDIDGFGWGWMPGPYGCGGGFGIGFGYGGYGWYGNRWHRHYRGGPAHRQYTNIAHAPAGYRAPVPPTAKGAAAPRIVRVGSPAIRNAGKGIHGTALRNPRAVSGIARSVRFNGTKIAPLHSTMTGVHVPVRNAALINNYPAHAFPGGVRNAMLNRDSALGNTTGRELHGRAGASRSGLIADKGARNGAAPIGAMHGRPGEIARSATLHNPAANGSVTHGSIIHASGTRGSGMRGSGMRGEGMQPAGIMHGSLGSNRGGAFNAPHGEPFAGRAAFGGDRGAFGNRAGFGQHTSFGPRGGFGGAFRGGSFGGRSGGFSGAHTSGFSGGHAGGFSGGGHGGGFSSGSHGGGGFSGGGGSHGGGGGGGGHAH